MLGWPTVAKVAESNPPARSEKVLYALSLTAAVVLPATLLALPQAAAWMAALGTAAWISQALLLPVLALRRQAWTPLIIGCALAMYATHSSQQLGERRAQVVDPRSAPSHDLRDGPVPADIGEWAHLRGYFYLDQRLDEYRVEQGTRPDQTQSAPAFLTPMVAFDPAALEAAAAKAKTDALKAGSAPEPGASPLPASALPTTGSDAMAGAQVQALQPQTLQPELRLGPDDKLIIAKVTADPSPGPGLETHFGHLGPIAPDLVAALIDLSQFTAPTDPDSEPGSAPPAAQAFPHALLFDTTRPAPTAPSPAELAWVALLGLLASAALIVGIRRAPKNPSSR